MLYVSYQPGMYETETDHPGTSSSAAAAASVEEDEVDQFLAKLDGKIYRERDEQL